MGDHTMRNNGISIRELEIYLQEYTACLQAHGEALLDKPMPEADEAMFSLYETTGNRLTYEAVYFARRKMLAVFGCLSLLEGKEVYLKKLEEVLDGICEEECWALPAHINRKEDADWRNCVDLFASETAQALSEIISGLGDRLPPALCVKVRENVYRRVLKPFMEAPAPYAWWEGGDNNWNAVCCGSIGCAAIYLLQDKPEVLRPLLDRIVCSLESYIAGFSGDGACMEGLGYFTYGMTYYTGFADKLYRYTDGGTDLMEGAVCRQIACFQQKCYFPSGRTLSFSDGDSRDTYKMGLTCFLAMRYAEVEIPPLSCAGGFDNDSCYRFMANYRDVLWTREYLDRAEKGMLPAKNGDAGDADCLVLPGAQWSICRGLSGGGMAVKGGNNGEPHNHNDVGSFLYLAGEEMLLTDLGAGEYTRDYFGDKRYEILCNQSLGHSVPILDGEGQKAGRQYACRWFEADGRGGTVLSFGEAYGKEQVKELVRSLRYDPVKETLLVEDVLEGREKGESSVSMKENLVTQYYPEITGNNIYIAGRKYGCRITVEELEGSIGLEAKKHANHKGVEEEVYCITWEVPADNGKPWMRKCRFRVEMEEI